MSRGGNSPERFNWLIQLLYTRQEFDECLAMVETALTESRGLNEYPLYIKALIMRQQGKIAESLTLFQSATCLNPANLANLKQVGHSLYLLGKHKQALDVYKEAMEVASERSKGKKGDAVDWELWHNSGLCYTFLQQPDKAVECFERANRIGRHDATFSQLGKVYAAQNDHAAALKVYQDALDFSPENAELLCTIGLTYLRLKEHQRAFDFFGNSLTFDPRNAKAILAAGSIIQEAQEMDVALHKYRVAAVQTPHSPQLWNNVGMALFGKDPFEWITAFNLGLVHLHTGQYASAFHHLNASVNLKPDFAATYSHLGVALAHLGDDANADAAFEKAIAVGDAAATRLNFAISLFNRGLFEEARMHFAAYENLAEKDADAEDEESLDHADMLRSQLFGGEAKAKRR
mmetsp:Transcript_7170/g.23360  ORF Transcript_7170/g.23360 Transcript_7170/m.23360 type:complete len:404 (-) Transcript_7170:32-1243(-)